MMRPAYDLIVFDWDGTLIDSVGWIVDCLHHAAEACGLPQASDAAARAVIGLGLGEAMQTLFPQADQAALPLLVQAYKDHYSTRELGRGDLFDGVLDMLDDLKVRGYRLAVATGKGRSGLQQAMRATGTSGLFHATRCCDETASKPDPLMLLELMREIGAPPARTLMIGDSVHDMKMAGNAQVAAVGVACGANSREQLLEYNPLYCLSNTAQLMELLA